MARGRPRTTKSLSPNQADSRALEADVVIAGSGIMGSSLKRAAEAVGLSALTIGLGTSNSAAAVGVIRMSWLPDPYDQALAVRSLEMYREAGMLVTDGGASFTDQRSLDTMTPHPVGDFYAVDIDKALLAPNIKAEIECFNEDGVHIYPYPKIFVKAKLGVFVALGMGTGRFRTFKDERITYGATIIIPTNSAEPGLQVHQCAPYKLLTRTQSPTAVRIGSSTSTMPDNAKAQLQKMCKSAPDAFKAKGNVLVGGRLHYKKASHVEYWETPRLCYVCGFGKMGFALAPALAEFLVKKMIDARTI